MGGGGSGGAMSAGAGGVTETSALGGMTGTGGAAGSSSSGPVGGGGVGGGSGSVVGGSGGVSSDTATDTSTRDSAAGDASGHPAGAQPFGGHFYQAFTGQFTGPQAEANCESTGGHLAVIHSAAENAFISGLAKADRPWFGLNNVADQKHYVWIDNSAVDYTNWKPGQPDNPANERWVKMEADGTWDDGATLSGYVCEWDN